MICDLPESNNETQGWYIFRIDFIFEEFVIMQTEDWTSYLYGKFPKISNTLFLTLFGLIFAFYAAVSLNI